ncbi:MAG: hypothetical protein RLZZ129_2548, partial [Verrucomicrobiota bacterium]
MPRVLIRDRSVSPEFGYAFGRTWRERAAGLPGRVGEGT